MDSQHGSSSPSPWCPEAPLSESSSSSRSSSHTHETAITAPTLATNSPPSARKKLDAAAAFLFHCIQQLEEGFWPAVEDGEQEVTRVLSHSQYDALLDAIEKHHPSQCAFNGNRRFEWDAETCEFTLKMPADPIHDKFAQLLGVIVEKHVRSLRQPEYESIASTAQWDLHRMTWSSENASIAATKATTVTDKSNISTDRSLGSNTHGKELSKSKAKISKKAPDACLRYDKFKQPPLVIEVSHSQNPRKLKKKAFSMMKGTQAQTRTMIAVDIEYWPPGLSKDRREVHYTIYRTYLTPTSDGRQDVEMKADDPVPLVSSTTGTSLGYLELRACDIFPLSFLAKQPASKREETVICIPHVELVDIFAIAERKQADDALNEDTFYDFSEFEDGGLNIPQLQSSSSEDSERSQESDQDDLSDATYVPPRSKKKAADKSLITNAEEVDSRSADPVNNDTNVTSADSTNEAASP